RSYTKTDLEANFLTEQHTVFTSEMDEKPGCECRCVDLYFAAGLLVFREFLRSEYSEENLLFYLDCEAFRDLSSESDREAAAKRIYREFVMLLSPPQINIDCVTRAEVLANLTDPGPDCFNKAQRTVLSLMENDSYPRFVKSQLYQVLLAPMKGL
uniref:RGS domain-containing protein n=1 Tax=Neogobius melanostomus TaxID=47308 RepID=A0A8C6V1C9_9GOBI